MSIFTARAGATIKAARHAALEMQEADSAKYYDSISVIVAVAQKLAQHVVHKDITTPAGQREFRKEIGDNSKGWLGELMTVYNALKGMNDKKATAIREGMGQLVRVVQMCQQAAAMSGDKGYVKYFGKGLSARKTVFNYLVKAVNAYFAALDGKFMSDVASVSKQSVGHQIHNRTHVLAHYLNKAAKTPL